MQCSKVRNLKKSKLYRQCQGFIRICMVISLIMIRPSPEHETYDETACMEGTEGQGQIS